MKVEHQTVSAANGVGKLHKFYVCSWEEFCSFQSDSLDVSALTLGNVFTTQAWGQFPQLFFR